MSVGGGGKKRKKKQSFFVCLLIYLFVSFMVKPFLLSFWHSFVLHVRKQSQAPLLVDLTPTHTYTSYIYHQDTNKLCTDAHLTLKTLTYTHHLHHTGSVPSPFFLPVESHHLSPSPSSPKKIPGTSPTVSSQSSHTQKHHSTSKKQPTDTQASPYTTHTHTHIDKHHVHRQTRRRPQPE